MGHMQTIPGNTPYGEAVFEVRNIESIGKWASDQIQNQYKGNHRNQKFLTSSDFNSESNFSLQKQAEALTILIGSIVSGECES
jgi:hypothetical protein